jgi:hypothetical protein
VVLACWPCHFFYSRFLFIFFLKDFAKKGEIRIRSFLEIPERFENSVTSEWDGACDKDVILGGEGLLAKMPKFEGVTNWSSRSQGLYVVLDNRYFARAKVSGPG